MGNFPYWCHPVLPAVFDDSLSYYEVVCRLSASINDELQALEDITEQIESLKARMDSAEYDIKSLTEELDAFKREMKDSLVKLYELILQLTGSMLQYDVQHGIYTDSATAQRDMFNDVTVHGITVSTLNSLDIDVQSLSECGLNVRGLAVIGLWLIDKFDIPDYFIYSREGDLSTFTPIDLLNSYVEEGFVKTDANN